MHTHDPSYILELFRRIFGDPAKASDWLDRACEQLGGNTARDMLGNGHSPHRLLLQLDDDQRPGSG